MSFLFNKKKSSQDLIKSVEKNLKELNDSMNLKDEKGIKKAQIRCAESLSAMKVIVLGEGDAEPRKEQIDSFAQAVFESKFLLLLVQNMSRFEFESRKDIGHIIASLFRYKRDEVVAYLLDNQVILTTLVSSYENPSIALTCGSILRDLIRSEEICKCLLQNGEVIDNFLKYIQLPVFDVSSDAFSTFKTMLTKHKKLVCQYLYDNFHTFFPKFNLLLQSDSYVTKRLSLKLLAEILLSRDNFSVMMQFINIPNHLKLIMNLLRGTTRSVQLEAFHVFKIFVANPRKDPAIVEILYRNRAKLIDFLARFQKDKDDEQFTDEKNILLNTLTAMEPPASM